MTGTPPTALRPQHPSPRSLHGLAETFGFDVRGDIDGVEVTGAAISSRTVQGGDLYVGVPGRHAHGADFAAEAGANGAVAVLTDASGAEAAAAAGLPVLVTADPRAALGDVAAWIHRTAENPATFFAVTGTNGKTSVVYLLYGILRQLGVVAGLTSTAERRIGDEAVTSSLTTPEASEMHALLARMREVDVRAVGIEVSAQALTRHRVDGLVFDVAAFTNLTHDHMDDYESMEHYYEAKRELFQPERARRAVITVDSEWGRRLVGESRIPVTTLATDASVEADWHVTVTEETPTHTGFELAGPGGRRLATSVPLLGHYMAANAALAIVMLVESGYDLDQIAHALGEGGIDAYIPGRVERISGDRGPVVYIDYGHTPTRSCRRSTRSAAPRAAASSWCSEPTATETRRSARTWARSPRAGPTSSSSPTSIRAGRTPPRSAPPSSSGARAAVPTASSTRSPTRAPRSAPRSPLRRRATRPLRWPRP